LKLREILMNFFSFAESNIPCRNPLVVLNGWIIQAKRELSRAPSPSLLPSLAEIYSQPNVLIFQTLPSGQVRVRVWKMRSANRMQNIKLEPLF